MINHSVTETAEVYGKRLVQLCENRTEKEMYDTLSSSRRFIDKLMVKGGLSGRIEHDDQ